MIPPRNSLAVGGVPTSAQKCSLSSSGLRNFAAALCTILLSLSGELPKYTARVFCTEPRFQEPARSCFLLAFYAKLSQASTRVWPVILTSGRSPVGTGRDEEGF